MIDTNEIRKGVKIEIENQPFTVVDFQHVKPGKGNTFTRVKLKNLQTGQVLEKTFKSGERLEQPNLENHTMQYLYSEENIFHFMDSSNYEQITLNKSTIGNQSVFLKENLEVEVLFFNGKPINVELPVFAELVITYCEPGFRGDTATGATKPATLEGGHICKVPLHLKEGDKLKIDTRTGEYVEKINK